MPEVTASLRKNRIMGFCIFSGFILLGAVPLCFDPGYFRDTIGPAWWYFCWFLLVYSYMPIKSLANSWNT